MNTRGLFVSILFIGAATAAAPFLLASGPEGPMIKDPLPPGSLQQVMEGISAAEKNMHVPEHDTPGIIVPHDLRAAEAIASGIRMMARLQPKIILLLSPDHFDKCPTVLCTTYGFFPTVLGEVRTQHDLVEDIAHSHLVTLSTELFDAEHGIAAVLPFIKHTFPDATVVPVVISDGWFEDKEAVLALFQTLFDRTGNIVVSSDFSHTLSLAKADIADEATAEVLFTGHLPSIAKLKNPDQTDCTACFWMFASLAQSRNFFNPSVILHTNSARILQDEKARETTSHFVMAFFRNNELTPDDLAVAGDVTMTRTRRTPKLKPMMQEFWNGNGLRFVNLEGPVEEVCALNRGMFDFCNAAPLWKGMRNLATHWAVLNNHTFDQYAEGLGETKRIIAEAGETWVGDTIIEAGNVRLISLTALMNSVSDTKVLDIPGSYEYVLRQLREKKEPEMFTVVLTHAGKEYAALGSAAYNDYLRSFVDAGADAVVAAHTHVLGDMEIYNGKPIFRGVGNFIFDQFDKIATSTSMAVRLRKEGEKILFETLRTKE